MDVSLGNPSGRIADFVRFNRERTRVWTLAGKSLTTSDFSAADDRTVFMWFLTYNTTGDDRRWIHVTEIILSGYGVKYLILGDSPSGGTVDVRLESDTRLDRFDLGEAGILERAYRR